MGVNRRAIVLCGAAALSANKSFPPALSQTNQRVSQKELDEAIRLHALWLENINIGQRCTFSGRDLRGLKFGNVAGRPVNLSGADFSQTNLSQTEADDILVHYCNFNGAIFDACRWRQPVFAHADMRRISAKASELGWPAIGATPRADFSYTALNDSDLYNARILGCFYGARFGGASLVRSDFSGSEFSGPSCHEMSFAGAQLIEARFCDCRISSASFFNAECRMADFSRTTFSNVKMKGCNLTGAIFRGAEFRRTEFASNQLIEADFCGSF